eukprot:m.194339 g.194339  ORF g.194339 m.194339 type:complete len:112 (-) comp15674_c0_seq21:1841-2176(-)
MLDLILDSLNFMNGLKWQRLGEQVDHFLVPFEAVRHVSLTPSHTYSIVSSLTVNSRCSGFVALSQCCLDKQPSFFLMVSVPFILMSHSFEAVRTVSRDAHTSVIWRLLEPK